VSQLSDQIHALLRKHAGRRSGLVVGVRVGRESGFWHRGALPDGPSSIFEIGSVTKTFTATLLADLAREGVVAFDDPVQRHLPDGVRLPVRGREITLEELASHRSGLPRLPKGLLLPALTRDRRDPYAKLDDARLAEAVSATRPRREPGRKIAYSNYAMGLLGHVLALRAGTSYEGLVRSRICEPLGLRDTWIEIPERERGRLATGHTWRGRPTSPWHLAALAGAGGLRSTAADVLAFLDLHTARSQSPRLAAHPARASAALGAAAVAGAVTRGRHRRLPQLRGRDPGARRLRRRAGQPGPLGRPARVAGARRASPLSPAPPGPDPREGRSATR
jgi:CubicO group peptidase (beta-lactamase class C family)